MNSLKNFLFFNQKIYFRHSSEYGLQSFLCWLSFEVLTGIQRQINECKMQRSSNYKLVKSPSFNSDYFANFFVLFRLSFFQLNRQHTFKDSLNVWDCFLHFWSFFFLQKLIPLQFAVTFKEIKRFGVNKHRMKKKQTGKHKQEDKRNQKI